MDASRHASRREAWHPSTYSHENAFAVPTPYRANVCADVDIAGASNDNATMAQAGDPDRVKLICGMISARIQWLDEASDALAGRFGDIDHVSDTWPFDLTHYYDEEMGSPLLRRFVSFRKPVSPDVLVEVKLTTNEIEAQFGRRQAGAVPARPVNLDPGLVEPSKLVLASMKNFSHRIYLTRGVYAEVTLMFRKGAWEALPWTFPDFGSGRYDAFLTVVRDTLRKDGQP